MVFDVLIIGGGAAGMSCALMLGSAKNESYAKHKKIGIIIHQRSSSLQNALFNNVLGVAPGTTGVAILTSGIEQLENLYPEVTQIAGEKVLKIEMLKNFIEVSTNKNTYAAKNIVVATGPKNFDIEGLEHYTQIHSKIAPEKQRTELKHKNFVVTESVYVAGVLAGLRSQFAIACGSGASVATDILCKWNNGNPVKIHDKITPQ